MESETKFVELLLVNDNSQVRVTIIKLIIFTLICYEKERAYMECFPRKKSVHLDKKDCLLFFRNITSIKFKIVVSDLL